MNKRSEHRQHPLSFLGVIVSLGIVFGDIGTSPLYVLKAILSASSEVNELLIIGTLSCIIWTLTLQTTIKYVLITLRADNKGEGGIFSLFALLRKRHTRLYLFAIIGGSALLADGVITPSITVMSAIEGLALIEPSIPVIPIVLLILGGLFFIQRYGTAMVGKSFGPLMAFWFLMLGVLGMIELVQYPSVLKAFNPYYIVLLLSRYPEGFLLLAAVFLCTTGAEALYADLGHCGLKNIRISWVFVKTTLIINYLGQGAWILSHPEALIPGVNPFYAIIPDLFLPVGVAMAALAAIIASQALISGSFTLVSEAISLNFWPKTTVKYPSHSKGQMYIPALNWILFVSCWGVVLLFQNSSNMEAAYGLSISITMLMTTLLVIYYLDMHKVSRIVVGIFAISYLIIEGAFLIANAHKFPHGGWFTIVAASILSGVMLSMYRGRKVRNRYITYQKLEPFLPVISDMSLDQSIPQYAGNLVYTTHADRTTDLEAKTIQSILNRSPKRADRYWFLHVDILDEPNVLEYKVTELWPGKIMRVDFYLGFKVQPRIHAFFGQVLQNLSAEGRINLISNHPSLSKHNIPSDFRFVHIDRRVVRHVDLGFLDQFALQMYYRLRRIGISDIYAYGLDEGAVTVEQTPLSIPGRSNPPVIHKRRGA